MNTDPWQVRTGEILLTNAQWSLVELCGQAIGVQWPMAVTLLLMEGLTSHALLGGNEEVAANLARQSDLMLDAIAARQGERRKGDGRRT